MNDLSGYVRRRRYLIEATNPIMRPVDHDPEAMPSSRRAQHVVPT